MFSSDECNSELIHQEDFTNCGVKDISKLHLKKNITTLSFHYNSIQNINGLNHLNNLRHLDLSSNLITKITGLDKLIYLRTLNLSTNRIKKIEGLNDLIYLVKLNVSYNDINDLVGLSEFKNITNHPLSCLELQGNQVRLLSQLTRNCQKLPNLKQMTLKESNNSSNNPVCQVPDYRNKVLKALPQLTLLDGQDRQGNYVELNILSDIPGLEQFMDFLSTSTEPYYIESEASKPKIIETVKKTDDIVKETHESSELKEKLINLEDKLNKYMDKNEEKPIEKIETKIEKENPKNADLKLSKLIKELDREKHKKFELENKTQILINKYKEIQLSLLNERKAKERLLKENEDLNERFNGETQNNQMLEEKIQKLEEYVSIKDRNVNDYQRQLEYIKQDLTEKLEEKDKQILMKTEELLQKRKFDEECQVRVQLAESNSSSLRRQCSQLEEQIDQLQQTMARREKDYQSNLSNKFSLDSKELKNHVQNHIEIAHQQSKRNYELYETNIVDLNRKYKELEDEFRYALHSEADRYNKLESSFRNARSENKSMKHRLEVLSKRDQDNKDLITEMTSMIKEQKSKISEFSRSKQELQKDSKERILTLEAHLEEARKQMTNFELTKQENKKLHAKLSAQESVIEGLKTERKLWSEELAQQGYLLTQDRSKLECKIEAQAADISSLKMELEKEAEIAKSKCKMNEEQTATILKLKEGLLDKDREYKDHIQKLLDDQKQLEALVAESQKEKEDLYCQIDKLTRRKEELKDVIGEMQQKLEESQTNQKMLNDRWKEKSELIAKLEGQVIQMRTFWEKKTEELTEERDEALDKLNQLKIENETLDERIKSQHDISRKEIEFIRQQADENIASVEEEMRKLLHETDSEKKKLKAKMSVLNRAIGELGGVEK